MDSSSKFGVIEAIGVASGSVALLNTLRRIISHMSDERFSERKATLKLVEHQLENTIKEYKRSSGSLELPAVVQEHLKHLEKVAEELEKNVSSHKLRRVWDKLTHKGFEERIGKLRTGISDIANALTVPASLNQVGPAMSQQHQISAAAPALSPAQRLVQMNITFTQPCPITLNWVAGPAPGFNLGQIAHQAAPIGYPPTGYPPTSFLQMT